MADKRISALPGASTPLAGTEVLPIVQGGDTVKVAVSNLTAGRDVAVLNLAATQTVGTSLGSGGVYLSGNGGPDTGFVGYNYKNISGTESVPEAVRASWREGFLNGAPVEWNVSYRAAASAVSSWTKYLVVGSTGDVTTSVGNFVPATAAKGINFTANTPAAGMTSQLLNDYEEGTWTPTISGTTTAGTGTYVAQVGAYTKIGRQVTVYGRVRISAHTGTGNMLISNLPFGLANDYAVGNILAGDVALTALNYPTILMVGSGSTNIIIVQLPVGGGTDTSVPIDTNCDLIFSITYFVS